jgi:hypothetical protein
MGGLFSLLVILIIYYCNSTHYLSFQLQSIFSVNIFLFFKKE